MNYTQVSRMLGIISLLFAVTMLFSLPWAHPALGWRNMLLGRPDTFEWNGFIALLKSSGVATLVGGVLMWWGRKSRSLQLFRKEAMATVGLSWILATVLGALPYLFADVRFGSGAPIGFADALFESQSGFSTTGATVLTDLENSEFVPHCILFWRSSTHFLGGLGIIVLIVAVLGQGAAGKAMMRAEITGPTKDSSYSRMQKMASVFAIIYCILNLLLAVIYWLLGMTLFDSLCHAFGTMATGGFSTYNRSLGEFNSPAIEYVTVVFMILAGTNFGLLVLAATGNFKKILGDAEWQAYIAIILLTTVAIMGFGIWTATFTGFMQALRHALFQVVSILTTTGYGTTDFDVWSNFGRGVLLLLMFVGGCSGSTAGGMKVIRHVLLAKILRLELELSYRPNVIRPLQVGSLVIDDVALRKSILVYFGLVAAIFSCSWLLLITIEPDQQWLSVVNERSEKTTESMLDHKLLDCGSAIAATLNNVGPGLGVVGPMGNYAGFSSSSKLLFVFLMMLGRLEMFSILVLFVPAFWRKI